VRPRPFAFFIFKRSNRQRIRVERMRKQFIGAQWQWTVFGVLAVALTGCGPVLTNGPRGTGVTLESGSADGTGGSAPASASETSVTVTASSGSAWSSFLVDLGTHFTAENICDGKTIFGRLGTSACMSLIDNRFNDVGTPETKRKTPRAAGGSKDDDGYYSSSVVEVDRTGPGGAWAARTCGITAATSITERIADCVEEFDTSATWDGATKSNISHGKFVLVSRAASNKEVWRDERTGLLWSSSVGATTYNWCRAAGVGGAGTDDDGICTNAANQNQTNPQSVCAEGANSDGFTLQEMVAGENWTAGTYDNGKGTLGAHADAGGVEWRLPTREDFLQAYANGIGYVIPDLLDGNNYWLSSLSSANTNTAWYFFAFDNGYFEFNVNLRTLANRVRCVGR
jgi:hypothetical protein